MKIGLFGGSFDPIHHGHLLAVTDALEQGGLDRVIVVPAAQAPLREAATQTGADDRLAMVRLALAHEPRFEVSDWELRRGGVNYSVDTAAHFVGERPGHEWFWIIGEDQLGRLGQWREIGRLASLVTFLVLERPGYQVDPASVPPGVRLLRCRGHRIELSSTEIRARAAAGLSLEGHVPHKAVAYLQEKRLYQPKA